MYFFLLLLLIWCCAFLVLPEASWSFLTPPEVSWHFLVLHYASYCFLLLVDSSWQFYLLLSVQACHNIKIITDHLVLLPEVGDPAQVVGQEAVEHRDGLVQLLEHPHLSHVSRVLPPGAHHGEVPLYVANGCGESLWPAQRPALAGGAAEPGNHRVRAVQPLEPRQNALRHMRTINTCFYAIIKSYQESAMPLHLTL